MKKIQSLSFLATLAIAFGMISWSGAAHAQTTSTPSDQQQPQTQPTPQNQPTPDMPPADQQKPDSSQTPTSQQPSSQTPDAQSPSQTPPPDTQSPSNSPDSPDSRKSPTAGSSSATGTDSQVFSGTVVKQGDKYVLKDDAGKTYDIDHQTDVAKFEGKRVRVQGTLDPSGNKIMVK